MFPFVIYGIKNSK